MKTKKLSFEDFKENQLGRKQIVTILGGDITPPPPGEFADPSTDPGPVNPGDGSSNPGGGKIVKP